MNEMENKVTKMELLQVHAKVLGISFCLLKAFLFSSVASLLYFLRRRIRFMMALLSAFVIKGPSVALTTFFFSGAYLFKTLNAIAPKTS